MLKVRYQTADNKVTGWCADPTEYDGLVARTGEEVGVWDIDIPSWPMRACLVNTSTQQIELDPAYLPSIPTSITRAVVSAFRAAEKCIKVKRNWQGYDLDWWCYASQQAYEAYQASNLSIGDHVLVVFVDGDKDKAVVIDKVYQP